MGTAPNRVSAKLQTNVEQVYAPPAVEKIAGPVRQATFSERGFGKRHIHQFSCVASPVVKIYRPCRSVMQSGGLNPWHWFIEFEPYSPPFVEPLMGWTGSSDTMQQVRMRFPTKERAIAFAERHGWIYTISEPHDRKPFPKSYADNFRWRPPAGNIHIY